MLIKSINKNWSDSINFIDKFDNFVGYDTGQHCCEYFGWFFSAVPGVEDGTADTASEGYWWDTAQPVVYPDYRDINILDADGDGTGVACFKSINADGNVLWLTLYNSHNGFYSHGWEAPFLGEKGSL